MSGLSPYDLRAKYKRFRILVIGRANAGKTTLLQRVCNTTEDPCIYDENDKNLLEPTSARGIHDINRPFVFKSNPGFIFHDSPGFETGDKRQLQEVLSFIEKKAKSGDVDDQLHAIWFCFVLNNVRPLLPLETEFFETARAGKVPVIAIFTKFDDLMTQIYDIEQDDDTNRQNANQEVENKFRKPLYGYTFPPRADVCFEDLHNHETGKYQDQVKVLIKKTASSLDDTALLMLFVSVQQNNIEICIEYAIKDLIEMIGIFDSIEQMTKYTIPWFGHLYITGYDYSESENDADRWDRRWQWDADDRWRQQQIAHDFAIFLNPFFKSYDSSLGQSSNLNMKQKSFFVVFAALLICMENTFWSISNDGNFVELLKKSFALYVASGVRKQTEADIEKLRNELEGGGQVTTDFKEKFYNIIIEQRLLHPDDHQAYDSELEQGNDSETKRENPKKLTWLQNLLPKIRRGLGRRV